MSHALPSRRGFLRASGAGAFGAWALGLSACRRAADSATEAARTGEDPRALTEPEMRMLDALAGRIIPADGAAPGASEAGAVVFMDHFLAAQPEALAEIRAGLEKVDGGFAELPAVRQDEVVRQLEEDEPAFFGFVRFLTIAGTFAAPARGGNRDKAGWAIVGFDDRHSWQPPFGAYDAAASREGDA
jgi:hypothetical protein